MAFPVVFAEQRIAEQVTLPPGYFLQYGGQFEHLERRSRRLMRLLPAALALIFALLYLTYNRIADVLRIFLTLPLAAVRGVVALHLREMPFSISAGVGFVAMSGVSVLGDMVYVSFLCRMTRAGAERPVASGLVLPRWPGMHNRMGGRSRSRMGP